jgi:amidophosphoribosyltransferase
MSGIFGVASRTDCVSQIYYGTDYHSHLGTRRGGMAVYGNRTFTRFIHNIEQSPFRSKFEGELPKFRGRLGIGCISDTDDQPLIIRSHLGTYALVTVARINNLRALVQSLFRDRLSHFSEQGDGNINPTELASALIDEGDTFEGGIENLQSKIDGSCTMLILTPKGLYASRDRDGRTPLIIGQKDDGWCAASETCALYNLGYRLSLELGPGETVFISADGIERRIHPRNAMKICAFLWIYYGFPGSAYEGRNVEMVRNRCGAALAKNDIIRPDLVAGIPDSGTPHAVGYANQAKIPYIRPFIKYSATWPRSFMPQDQKIRNLVARMKLIPIPEFIQGKRLLFCEDSIVRGTQLRETIQRLWDERAKEVHMRPACPPLIHSCRYLNFSRSQSELDLAGRRAIQQIGTKKSSDLSAFLDPDSSPYQTMVDIVRKQLNLTSLRYQTMSDMVEAIGLPKERLCTYCWDGQG